MDAFQNLFLRKLLERINAEISERSEQLANRKATDWGDYLARCEAINTLKLVANGFCQEIQQELMRDDEPRRKPNTRPTAQNYDWRS